ncbi:MAG: hypothetical protein EBR30_06790 [Cytophagia bacterium]|nr:hypothetical protein [Cytophagia bacterium]
MKKDILKIAGVKSEKDFYKKFPTEEAFMAKHGKELKKAAMGKAMVNKQLHQLTEWEGVPKYFDGGASPLIGMPSAKQFAQSDYDITQQFNAQNPGANIDAGVNPSSGSLGSMAGAAGMGLLQGLPQIISGIEGIIEQGKAVKKSQQSAQLSGLALQASQTAQPSKRKYVRPEDALVQPGQLGNPYGSGTNYLAENGRVIRDVIGGNPTEIQNIYNPGDIYTDGGYEPIESQNIKQYMHGGDLHEAKFGDYFQSSGQAQIGSAVGSAIGNALLPGVGGAIGQLVGTVGGNLLGGAKQAREMREAEEKSALNTQQAAFQQTLQNQFGSYLEDGGKVGDEYKWVSNTWQPQVIAKFGEYDVKDLLKPPHDADMLRSGGHLKEDYVQPSAAALFTGRPAMPRQMDNGGRMTSTNMMFDTDRYPRAEFGKESDMNGDLEIIEGGKAETLSYNPFLPEGGETVMFRGRSHDNGGIPINYGENGVEVEGGEPAVKLRDGGNESNMVVFGNMKLSKMAADEVGLSKAKGSKFKTVAEQISKMERKQNKLIDKATETADMTTGNSGYDQLRLNTSQAQLMGANMKLRNAAILKQNLAAVQNAILDTASELGVKSDKLAEGKIEKETDPRMLSKFGSDLSKAQSGFIPIPGAKLESMSFDPLRGGTILDYVKDLPEVMVKAPAKTQAAKDQSTKAAAPKRIAPITDFIETKKELISPVTKKMPDTMKPYTEFNRQFMKDNPSPVPIPSEEIGKSKFDFEGLGQMALSNILPFLRPKTKLGLDEEQLYPEYFALATNQLEPVQAQTFQPMLDTPMDISLNDQLNAIDAQSRAAIRAAGQNPAAQAYIMSQTLDAKNKVLGEQARINAANKMQTYDKNRALLNDAKLKNLQILDNQYIRQAQAKSNTKAQALEALKSISNKIAQNKLENQTLNVYENLYGYRFSPSGVAYNVNAPAQFNIPQYSGLPEYALSEGDKSKLKEMYEKVFTRDRTGNITGSRERSTSSRTTGRNGAIVKALKNL